MIAVTTIHGMGARRIIRVPEVNRVQEKPIRILRSA
jgi:hypothetical protein